MHIDFDRNNEELLFHNYDPWLEGLIDTQTQLKRQGTNWTLSGVTALGHFHNFTIRKFMSPTHGRKELFVSRLDTDTSWSESQAAAGDPEVRQADAGEGGIQER